MAPISLTRRSAAALGLAALASPAFAASPADKTFEALGARYLDEMVHASPISATQLGDHRFVSLIDFV